MLCKMRNGKPAICPVALAFVLLCILCNCGASGKNEKEVVEGLKDNEAFISNAATIDMVDGDYEAAANKVIEKTIY